MTGEETTTQDKIEIPLPTPHETQNIIERPNEAIPHVVVHEGRITHLEEQQAHDRQELVQQIDTTRAEMLDALRNAHNEQERVLEERLARLEEKLTSLTAPIVEAPPGVVDDIADAPGEAVEIVPEVEHVVEPSIPRGLRARRKAKHGK